MVAEVISLGADKHKDLNWHVTYVSSLWQTVVKQLYTYEQLFLFLP